MPGTQRSESIRILVLQKNHQPVRSEYPILVRLLRAVLIPGYLVKPVARRDLIKAVQALGPGIHSLLVVRNGYLVWESATIVDEPGLYCVTVQLWDTAPLPECTVDLTLRRCRRFKAKPGQKFVWTTTTVSDGRTVQTGGATGDKLGLVTVGGLKVTKARQRVAIRRK